MIKVKIDVKGELIVSKDCEDMVRTELEKNGKDVLVNMYNTGIKEELSSILHEEYIEKINLDVNTTVNLEEE